MKTPDAKWTEPFLTADLEDECALDHDTKKWHAKALRTLAKQLGFANDYYFPLIGAAQLIDGEK